MAIRVRVLIVDAGVVSMAAHTRRYSASLGAPSGFARKGSVSLIPTDTPPPAVGDIVSFAMHAGVTGGRSRSSGLLHGKPRNGQKELIKMEQRHRRVLLYVAGPTVGSDVNGLVRELAAFAGVRRVVPISRFARVLRIDYDRSVVAVRTLLARVRCRWSTARLVGV